MGLARPLGGKGCAWDAPLGFMSAEPPPAILPNPTTLGTCLSESGLITTTNHLHWIITSHDFFIRAGAIRPAEL